MKIKKKKNRALNELRRRILKRVSTWSILTLFMMDVFPCWTLYPGIYTWIPYTNLINTLFLKADVLMREVLDCM